VALGVVVLDLVTTASVVRLVDLVETDIYSMELPMVVAVVAVVQLFLPHLPVLLFLHTAAMVAAAEAEAKVKEPQEQRTLAAAVVVVVQEEH
jgi:hypothetical protein